MLKMMTFQGLLDQRPVPGTLDFLRHPQKLPSPSEADSEASMSEASSEDLAPPLEAGVSPELEGVKAVKKKKKPKALASVFNLFKGKKKKSSPCSVQPELPEPGLGLDSRAPTGRPEHIEAGAAIRLVQGGPEQDGDSPLGLQDFILWGHSLPLSRVQPHKGLCCSGRAQGGAG